MSAAASARLAAADAAYRRRALARRNLGLLALAGLSVAVWGAAEVANFALPRLIEGLPKTWGFFERAAPDLRLPVLFADERTQGSLAYWIYAPERWAAQLWQSVEMAILATLLGGACAFFVSFLASRQLSPHPAIHFLARRALELLRTMPDIVLALIFVFAFGIGPLAGVLAIAIHTTGALGKQFAEAAENLDERPMEGVRAAGGGLLEVIRFGALPQVLPNFASYALLRFEINVGAAAAIGFVGAGGIGQEFIAAINFGQFRDALAIMVMTIFVIFVIDLSSQALRQRLIEARA